MFYYYGLRENDKAGMVFLGVDSSVLKQYNDKGYGIFWCFNMNSNQSEEGKREKALCIDTDIKAFFVDLDDGTKPEMWRKIIESPLIPSMCVMTNRGFHLYWFTDKATIANFELVQKRLIDYYNADKKCKDIVRVLRVPGFKQWKDNSGFMVETIWSEKRLFYMENQIIENYPMSLDERRIMSSQPEHTFTKYSGDRRHGLMCWDQLNNLDQGELLLRMSGASYVNGEVYELKENSNSTRQIIVNNESTGCFINNKGHIIADNGFSKNVFNWLRWTQYGHSDKDIFNIIRTVVPEVFG